MNRYDLILFDLDGTIADTDEMIIQSMYTLYDKYRGGRRTPVEEIYYFSGPPIKDTLKKEFPDMDNDFMVQEFVDISWNNYDKYAKAYPYTKELLLFLNNNHIPFGVVTSKYRQSTIHCLEVIKINDLVSAFVCGDDVKNIKPDPEGIYLLMERFHIEDKKKVLYIGANNVDYLTARNAGVDVALVSWGPRKIDTSLTPEYWISSLKEVEDIVHG